MEDYKYHLDFQLLIPNSCDLEMSFTAITRSIFKSTLINKLERRIEKAYVMLNWFTQIYCIWNSFDRRWRASWYNKEELSCPMQQFVSCWCVLMSLAWIFHLTWRRRSGWIESDRRYLDNRAFSSDIELGRKYI